jgi:uncharacterized membrane protein YdjX (TVP38/TMEM64 family)
MKVTKILSGTLFIVVLVLFYYLFVHTGAALPLLESVRNLGLLGVVIAILLLAVFCVLPVPSEFLILMNIEIYGVVWGTLYSWIGAIIGAGAALLISRWFFKSTIERLSGKYLVVMNTWIHKRGLIFGLLGLRILPFPYHVVNYAAGVLGIRLWPFLWTTAIGILPYDIAIAFLSYGVHNNTLQLDIYLGLALVIVVLLGWIFRRKLKLFIKPIKN